MSLNLLKCVLCINFCTIKLLRVFFVLNRYTKDFIWNIWSPYLIICLTWSPFFFFIFCNFQYLMPLVVFLFLIIVINSNLPILIYISLNSFSSSTRLSAHLIVSITACYLEVFCSFHCLLGYLLFIQIE